MSYTEVIDEIQTLPHYREYTCRKCGHNQKVFILKIQSICEQCGRECKFRGFAPIGSELEDVIEAVLAWMGTGTDFDDAMKWKQVIDSPE